MSTRRISSVSLLILAMLLADWGRAAQVRQLGATGPVPSLSSLKVIEYSKTDHDGLTGALGYSELQELVNACQAYSAGVNVLPRFHEPIVTRGDTGIAVFRRVSPSVVMVVTANFKDDKITESGLGTGVIIDPSGYVLTNWHVINGFEAAIVFLKPDHGTEPDKNNAYGVKLIAQNEQADLALLKIESPPPSLSVVKLGDIVSVQVGEDIHIIGHPHGLLWSYSTGVVSQVRDNYDWQYSDGSKHLAKVLQMQTAINPGNSGGPVLDNNGNILGLVAMSEEGQNLNYAVAVDVIRQFVNGAISMRSRGSAAQVKDPEGIHYSGNTKDGFAVTKIVYPDLVSYVVRDAQGTPVKQIAETSQGAILSGSKPNAFGGFSMWIFKPLSGHSVSVRSSGFAPDLVSLAVEN